MGPHLPEEILDKIFACLRASTKLEDQEDDQVKLDTLAKISRASKACYRIARQYLYFALDLRRSHGVGYATTVHSFLSSLLDHPENVPLVQRAYLGDWLLASLRFNSDESGEALENPFEGLELRASALGSVCLSPDLRTRLLADVASYFTDAMLALILAICRNLKVLEFEKRHPPITGTSLVMAVCEEAMAPSVPGATQTRPLANLIEFESQLDSYDFIGCQEILLLLKMPTLETFRVRSVDLTMFPNSMSELKCSITRLFLTDCLSNEDGLAHLLGSSRSLEVLDIHWTDIIYRFGSPRLNIKRFGIVLRKLARKLKHLRLRTEHLYIDEDASTSLGSLKRLRRLRVLELPCDTLWGTFNLAKKKPEYEFTDILPESLRTLKIVNTTRDCIVLDVFGAPIDVQGSQTSPLIQQLLDLMRDHRFKRLSRVEIIRDERFLHVRGGTSQFLTDAQVLGWKLVKRDESILAVDKIK